MCAVRTFLWDPLRAVCAHLEIPQRKLSSFAKEVLGVSAPELVDKIKAEGVRARMKDELKGFIVERSRTTTRADKETAGSGFRVQGSGAEGKSEAEEVYEALQKSRRAPRFHRTTWAMSYGFSSYQKFFRACLLCYGKTPHQLELEIIEEILNEMKPQMNTDEHRYDVTGNGREAGGAGVEVVRRE
ncbi:MAG: hypothetical protein NTW87_10660 [Planctomycetota bacterium]|nr:hypothetical protein [Planctomycetota bacterium]